MFSCCFKRQSADRDYYHRRPKARFSLGSGTANTHPGISSHGTEESLKSLEELQIQCLEIHNELRGKHGLQPLTLNKELNLYASEWAKYLANNNSLQHRVNNKYGENLYLGTGTGPQTHVLAVQAWYDEIKNYSFKKPGFSPSTGHFTQVIWKTTKQLGVGIETRGNRTWVVCNYHPAGNNIGNYEKCVSPSIDEAVSKIIDKIKPQALRKEAKSIDDNPEMAPTSWSKFVLECLNSHNKYRALHGCPPMELNRSLCNLALEWSEHLADRSNISHRPNNEYGENIYYAMNFDPTAEDCVKSWYDEFQNYNYSKPGFSSHTGHFTQVVWKDSKELGVGVTKTNNNKTFVVCNYSPAGNIMNEFEEQVPRPGGIPSTSKNLKDTSKADTQQSFEEDCLGSHNEVRALHGSPAMILNKNLSFFANDWAQHLAKTNKVETRKNNRFGENIFCSTEKEIKGQDPVEYWYSSIGDYNFNRPEYTAITGSFTQVIWRSSKQLGVGFAKAGRSTYIVCNYDPRGNILDKFAENVYPVGGEIVLKKSTHQEPSDVDEFAENILKCHNLYRAKHGSPPLKLSQELINYCLSYAQQLIDNKAVVGIPRYFISYTIFHGFTPSEKDIVDRWYNEIQDYDFEKPGFNNDTRHFTQIIWKNTKFLGAAFIKRNLKYVVVVSYDPAGNIEHQYGENVILEI